MSAQPLDLLRTPLTGTTLVEASAGTGKTYSIAWLYLRLLLERRLPVAQILVVTFTEAAADELRSRIRARLLAMRAVLPATRAASEVAGGVAASEAGASLAERALVDGMIGNCAAQGVSLEQIRVLLDAAIAGFDEAAIHTIHAFCRRVLAEFALDGGVPLGLREPDNEVALRQRLLADFWRRESHSGDRRRSERLRRTFADPQALEEAIYGLLNLPPDAREPRDPHAALAWHEPALQQAFAMAQALWTAEAPAHLVGVLGDKRYGLSRKKEVGMDAISLSAVAAELSNYFRSGDALANIPDGAHIFQRERLEKNQMPSARNAGKPLPQDALLDALGRLSSVAEEVARWQRACLLVDACDAVREGLRRHEESGATLGFDALIGRLYEALHGERAAALAARLRQRYAVALVDEFQDTDLRQYAIFQRIYAGHGALLLIGDAKQAIYGFRGGDVYAYATAREDAVAQRFTLDTNYRAEPLLTGALNRIFNAPRSFVVDFIDWQVVRAGGPKQQRWLQPATPPLRLWHAEIDAELRQTGVKTANLAAVERLESRIAASVASEIVRLLHAGARSDLRFETAASSAPAQPVQAGDIAVLVVAHKQAVLIEQALRHRAVPVSRRARESVFESEQAHELIVILRALLEPSRLPRVRAALATVLLGFDAAQVQALDLHDRWDETLQSLAERAALWHERGVLSLVLELVREAAPRLLALADGERRLSNYLQLGALLDAAGSEAAAPAQLLAWLQRNRLAPDRDDPAQLLQRDSEAQAVQIVTIHGSKGLEYPIVFAPFLWHGKTERGKPAAPVICHDEQHRTVVDLGTDQLAARAGQRALERYAESMRLAYVACTRAINRLYLVWGTTAGAAHSPLFRLLDPEAADARDRAVAPDDAAIAGKLAQWQNEDAEAVALSPMPAPDPTCWRAAATTVPLRAREFSRSLYDPRRSQSFSRLVQGQHASIADHDRLTETPDSRSAANDDSSAPLRGPAFGECLHQILQRIEFARTDPVTLRRIVAEQVQRAGFAPASERQFLSLVTATLDALLLPDLRLRGLPRSRHVAEMEFHFRLCGASAQALESLVQAYPDYADALHLLRESSSALCGLMNGFVDLCLEHQQKFYVLDYKSNWLGASTANYAPPALARAMAQHRYDLQALIYQVALHRHLRLRLGAAYRSEVLGGALYVFVRGLDPLHPGNGVLHLPTPAALIEALDRCFDGA